MADPVERIWGLYAALDSGCISNYLESPDTAAENLQELQPTVLGADAEAWGHLHATSTRAAKGGHRGSAHPLRLGNPGRAASAGPDGSLANLLVLGSVRRELGLSKVRLAYTGGEPISPPTLDWARCLGISIERIEDTGADRGPAGQALRSGDATSPRLNRRSKPVVQAHAVQSRS